MSLVSEDKETIGVILLNLGGPSSLGEVRPFLQNLFSDREIIKLGPEFLQKPIAHLISVLRSKKTEKMYSLIGGKSPILDITMAQAKALEDSLNLYDTEKWRHGETESHDFTDSPSHRVTDSQFKVYIGMRYSPPFIKDTVERILRDGVKHLIVLPLYPHYSKATTGSAITEFKKYVAGYRLQVAGLKIHYIEQWYDFPPYIDALAELIAKGIAEFNENLPLSPFSKGGFGGGEPFSKGGFEKIPPLAKGGEGGFGEQGGITLLYSAHNLPESFINKGDPYLEHIKTTIREVNKKLSIPLHPLKWHLSFQSKSGPVKWLKPTTEETIIKLAKTGVKNLFVVPISFVSDNIETLYEIDILYKRLAEKHGINFKRCECLNTSEKFIEAMKELVMRGI